MRVGDGDVLTAEGQKLYTIARAVEPLPYEKKDIDFLLKEEGENMQSLSRSESLTKEYLRLIRFPKNKPFFRALVPMEDGRLAVIVDIEGYAATLLDLFDGQGRFLGRFKAEISPISMMFKKGKAYSLRKDDNGFLSIVRYGYEVR